MRNARERQKRKGRGRWAAGGLHFPKRKTTKGLGRGTEKKGKGEQVEFSRQKTTVAQNGERKRLKGAYVSAKQGGVNGRKSHSKRPPRTTNGNERKKDDGGKVKPTTAP